MRKIIPVAILATILSLFIGSTVLASSPSLQSTSPSRISDSLLPPSPVVSGGSGTVISRRIYLQYLSTYNISLGGTLSITGFVMKYDTGLETWVSGIGETLRVFLDGVEVPTVWAADVTGNFTRSHTLPTGWSDLSANHTLIADIPNASPYKSVVYNNTAQSFNVYTDSKITPESTVFAGYYLIGDSVTISGTLKNTAENHNIVGQTVNVVIGGSSGPVTTGSGGVFSYLWLINQENPSGSFSFAGVPNDYLPASTIPIALDTLEAGDADIKSLTYPSSIYEQNTIQVSGTLVLKSDGTTALPNRRILLEIYNATAEGTTDAQGKFNLQITVPNGVTTRDLNFTLLYANGMPSPVNILFPEILSVSSIFDPGNPENPLPYSLIFTIVGVVVAVIVVLVLIRRGTIKLKRARPVYEVDQKTLMDRVNALAAMGRLQEAMAYLLVKYLDALRFRMQMKKKPGQTVRDIATEAVRRHLHQAEILYPWTSFVEAAVYSGRTVTMQDLDHVKTFYQTAQEIVPFSEQELISLKPALEPETTPGQAMTPPPAPKNNDKGSGSKNASE